MHHISIDKVALTVWQNILVNPEEFIHEEENTNKNLIKMPEYLL